MTMNLRALLDAPMVPDIVVGDLFWIAGRLSPVTRLSRCPAARGMVGSILKRRSSGARQLCSARRRAPPSTEILVWCRYLRCAPGWVC